VIDVFKPELIIWKDIKNYDDGKMYNNRILLKCKEHGIYEGWFDDHLGGWRHAGNPDHLSEIMIPPPTHYHIVKQR